MRALAAAVLAIGGAGCIFSSGEDTSAAHITAQWTILDVAGDDVGCPAGFDTAVLYDQRVDPSGAAVGVPVIDTFDCAAGAGASQGLVPAAYRETLVIADHDTTTTYATSLPAVVDVTVEDMTFAPQILVDGGYVQLAWQLTAQGIPDQPCSAVGVETIALTLTDPSTGAQLAQQQYGCELGAATSAGIAAGTYTAQITALAGGAQLGVSRAVETVVAAPNGVADLGSVVVQLAN